MSLERLEHVDDGKMEHGAYTDSDWFERFSRFVVYFLEVAVTPRLLIAFVATKNDGWITALSWRSLIFLGFVFVPLCIHFVSG